MVAEGVPYHAVQRGNHRQRIFYCDADYRRYPEFLQRYARRHRLHVLGFCLMPNHVHLVVIPGASTSLARGIGQAHNMYCRWLNHRLDRQGHLWVRRYYAAPMDRGHLVAALRYVDRNPVRADLCSSADDFRWSSARAHVLGIDNSGLLDMDLWRQHVDAHRYWSEILGESRADEALVREIRASTISGRPIGSEDFQRELSGRLGRPWPGDKPGRPRPPKEAGATA